MSTEIDELTELAYEGSTRPLTTTPVVGTPGVTYADVLAPGAEELAPDEVRVTILGSGDPFVNKCQASASVLIEVGNEQRDFFFFDLGSGFQDVGVGHSGRADDRCGGERSGAALVGQLGQLIDLSAHAQGPSMVGEHNLRRGRFMNRAPWTDRSVPSTDGISPARLPSTCRSGIPSQADSDSGECRFSTDESGRDRPVRMADWRSIRLAA